MAEKPRAFYRGSAGREKAEEELARSKAKADARKEAGAQPFRFKVGVGENTSFVVVDDEPEFYRFEHNLKDPATQRWNIFTGCVKEWDNCPVCQTKDVRESYYALYLTVIDFTPFTTRDGTKVEYSRKLLVVKPGQQKKFHRAFAKAQKDGRTLRGAIFTTTRDGDKDSSIGNDIELDEFMEEDELLEYVRTWKDKEGKKHTENCSEPYDYEKMFAEPDTESLRAIVGAAPAPGSRAHEEKELGSRRPRPRASEEDDEDENWQKPTRSNRMAGKRAAAEEDEEEAPAPRKRGRAAVEDDEDEAPPPRKRGRAAPEEDEEEAPTPRKRGRAAPEPEDDDEDAAPPPRKRGRAAPEPEEDEPAPRKRPTGRRQAVEEDEEDEAPTRRPVPGAGRRAAR